MSVCSLVLPQIRVRVRAEAHAIIIQCQRLTKLNVRSAGFVQAVPERTTKMVDC